MNTIQQLHHEIISGIFALVLAAIRYLFRSKARIVWSSPHDFTFLIQHAPGTNPPSMNITTASIFVQNAGRSSANDVEITFNYRPENFNIWPDRQYETAVNPNNRFTIKLSSMSPKEHIQIELISIPQPPEVLHVRSKECVGNRIVMRPVQVFSKYFNRLIIVLLFFGIAAVFYTIITVTSMIFPNLI